MVEAGLNAAADDIEQFANESTSLIHVSLSHVDYEISKRDTHEPYVSVGHIGTTEFAAMTLASVCFGITAVAPLVGMMGAMETFCSNAFTASNNKTAVGFHFQRGIIAIIIHMTFAIPILWNGERILLAINQEPIVAELSGQYLRIQTLGIVPLSLFEACKCFLQSQEIMSGGTIVLLFVVPTHVVLNYVLVRSPTYGIGFLGAAIGDVFTYCFMLAGILVYIRFTRAIETWGGWELKAFRNMHEFYRLAIPSSASIITEWICTDLLNIGSSYFGKVYLAASAITLNTAVLTYQISNGLGYSTSPRIGNLIGAGKPRQARIARDMGVLIATCIGTLCLIFFMTCGRWWISIYTSDPDVMRETLKIMPVFCGFVICDAVNGVLNSIMRGLGRQTVGAASFTFSYYCISVPLGLYLGYVKNMQVWGLWLSGCIAVVISTLIQFLYLYMWVDWKDEVRRCLVRLQRSYSEQNEVSANADNQHYQLETMENAASNVEATFTEHGSDESTSLLHVSPSQASIEILKRDTREPYFIVAIKELKWMTSSSLLTALTLVLQQCILFIDVVSVGHLGATELSAMTLAATCFNFLAMSPAIGIMGAMETFCSNAYTASRDKTMVGFHFQRGIIAIIVHMSFVIPIMWNGERILLAIKQDPKIAELSGQYLRTQILGIVFLSIFEACKCFLQSQEIMKGGTIVLMCAVPIHIVVNYIFVRSEAYGIGFHGAAMADVFTYCLMLAGILLYIKFSRAVETWGGWELKAFRNMHEFYRLAIPAVIITSSDCVCFEMLNIGSSYFGPVSLAATAITLNTVSLGYQISNGLGYSTGPRIGNLIGAGKPRQARIARDISILAAVSVGSVCILFLSLCGRLWISVYTDDPDIVRNSLKLMPVVCAFIVCDSLNAVLNSVLRGLGRQMVGASSFMISNIFIAIPGGLYLGFKLGLEVQGLWWALCISVTFTSLVQWIYAYIIVDWKDEVRRCLIRLRRNHADENIS
ncbi:MATE efflux family protein [Coemansia reversa NRRL 1564]|uniref:MATE efflux family protein n=1 Tax=Coemansia reversa (strain ATCC 12441 / NRRL 1564) TaxID=763665 RepID=A0A2G5B8I6_COERN|nr:MATE efflux family protein [Coemansia reversa NRRL 1564]|eukprot:PIA15338.1 MATE efflux family protein [Coemansia reversa NRRL 1564]